MMMLVLGFLFLLLLGAVVVALLIGGVGLLRRGGDGSRLLDRREEPTAREVLDQRLARGEISREEYEELREQIES